MDALGRRRGEMIRPSPSIAWHMGLDDGKENGEGDGALRCWCCAEPRHFLRWQIYFPRRPRACGCEYAVYRMLLEIFGLFSNSAAS